MSSVENNTISWEWVVSTPRAKICQSGQLADLADLFVRHADEVRVSIYLLSKLCAVLVDAPNELAERVGRVFEKHLSKARIKSEWVQHLDPSILEHHTPLTFACGYLEIDVIEKLLKIEEVNKPNQSSATPWMVASQFRRIEVVELLYKNGADPTAQDCKGMTALHYACQNGYLELVEKLFPATTPSLKDKKGWTPLMVAIDGKQPHVVQFILKNGTQEHFEGLTELDLACLRKDFVRAETLFKGAAFFSGIIPDVLLTELLEFLKNRVSSCSKIIDKMKLINKLSKFNVSLSVLTESIIEEYYTKLEVENDCRSHCSKLKEANTPEEIRQAITSSQGFIDELPSVFDFFVRFYGGTPESILSMRKQILKALEGAKTRLRAFSIQRREDLREAFSDKGIHEILFEWGVCPRENQNANHKTELGKLQIERMIDEIYIEVLGVNREQIKQKGFHTGSDLVEKLQIDNELEVLAICNATNDELIAEIDKKMESAQEREQLAGKTYFRDIRDKLSANGSVDSLRDDLIKAEHDFNLAVLRGHFSTDSGLLSGLPY